MAEDNVVPFPIDGPAVCWTPKAVSFEALSAPQREGPLVLHFRLENDVELRIPIDDELVYELRGLLNKINPPRT